MSQRWKIVIILAVLAFSVWSLYPTVSYYSMSEDERGRLDEAQRTEYLSEVIKLGLDLQGGMHVVLEVDDSKLDDNAKKDATDRVMEIMRNRIDAFGVSEPVIQKQGEKRVILQLPGVDDPNRVRGLIGSTAQLSFNMVREQDEIVTLLRDLDRVLKGVKVDGRVVDTTGVDLGMDEALDETELAGGEDAKSTMAKLASAADQAVDGASQTLQDAADSVGLDSIPFLTPPAEELDVPLQIDEDRPFTSYLATILPSGGLSVDVNNRDVVEALLNTEQAKRVVPRQSLLRWTKSPLPDGQGNFAHVLYLVDSRPIISGAELVDAVTRPDPDDPTSLNVGFRLNRQGGLKFARATGENIGRFMAIVLDDKVNSAPRIQSKISGGEGRITGLDTDSEANDLAIVLRAGALPAPVDIIEERTVGPSLGRDSIEMGIRATVGGFVIVMIFMVIYYQMAGLIACMALILNLVIILAFLAEVHAALTLPGIAGLILTIGMAIDANVLIFERIREELAKSKTVRASIEAGYDRAFTTILDANVTTLITAFILWYYGTGPIKGFATTLSIGIAASMFTALVCTRVVFDLMTANRQLKKLSI